jgi:acrylyl-CoA reductase (NADPH)
MGPIVVTGATGGVGSVAVSILAARGYRVLAVSGRPEHADYLRGLGAAEVVAPADLQLGSRPLEAARYGGVVDNVGGELLAGLVRHVGLWGQVACIGMASSPELATSIFPLILRGVSLLGVSSGNCPMPLRHEVWTRVGRDLKPPQLGAIASREVPLAQVIETAPLLMERRALGRILVGC